MAELDKRLYELPLGVDLPAGTLLLVDHPDWAESKRFLVDQFRAAAGGEDPNLVLPIEPEPSSVPGRAVVYFDGLSLRAKLPDGGNITFAPSITDLSGALFRIATVTGAHAALPHELIPADSSGGPFTVSLPFLAVDGTPISLYDPTGSWSTNPVTLARLNPAHKLGGVAEDMLLDAGTRIDVVWSEAEADWQITTP